MVKQDTYHLKRRFTSAVPRTHRLYKAFCSELSDVLLPVYAGEHERLGPMDPKAFRRKARKHIPPGTGQLVLGGVASLLQKYRAAPGGETFITADVLKVLENQQALVGPGLDLISGKFGMNMGILRAEGGMLVNAYDWYWAAAMRAVMACFSTVDGKGILVVQAPGRHASKRMPGFLASLSRAVCEV